METNNSKPLMLSTQELLVAYWPQVEPLLASAPISEEFPPEAIYRAVLAVQMFMFAFVKETDVEMVLVFSATPSETLPVMTVIAVAGKNLKAIADEYWEYFKGWCIMNGARAIDAYVPDRMVKYVETLGLQKETVHVRLRL